MLRRHAALAALLLATSACGREPTACDGFDERTLGITASEYRACAGEILVALDEIEAPLRAIVAGTATDDQRSAARGAYQKLRTRIQRTGIEADYRSMQPGTAIVKWPSGAVSDFNRAAFTASIQYGAVLAYPSADNLGQGVRAHAEARRYHRAIR